MTNLPWASLLCACWIKSATRTIRLLNAMCTAILRLAHCTFFHSETLLVKADGILLRLDSSCLTFPELDDDSKAAGLEDAQCELSLDAFEAVMSLLNAGDDLEDDGGSDADEESNA